MSKKHQKTEKSAGKRELRSLLFATFKENPAQRYNYKQLARQLGITNVNVKRLIIELLDEMKQEGVISEPAIGAFALKMTTVHVTGTIDLTAKGTAYLVPDEGGEDVFIPQVGLKHALNGDKVKAVVYARNKWRRPEGEVVEILERKRETFVGVLQLSRHHAFLIPSGKRIPYDILIPLDELNGAKDGEKVVVKIIEWPERQKNLVGTVLEVLGQPGDNDAEMNAIMAEFELPVKFPPAIEKAAAKIKERIDDDEIARRRDFRGVATFTIDPADAKDFDDALSTRVLDNGNREVGVHIADVSHYVQPDTPLDREAYQRATSVYLVDRTIPMLPEHLSNGLCSLRPGEDKLCFSAVFELNARGAVVTRWFGRTVIRSGRRFAYEEAQAIIEGGDGEFQEEIRALDALARKLRADRLANGALDFDRAEARFEIDANGKPLRVYFKHAREANKLIEEFMLLANREVAERVGKVKAGEKAKTFVYRVHEDPDPAKLADFSRFIAKFGYRLRSTSSRALSTSMNKLMADVKNRPEQNMIETLALRSMAKAVYSTENVGHYGLAFDYYSHFTSPIRRYPDVMTHRLLQRYLDGGRSAGADAYEGRCKHCSDMEQLAANAERASIKYKQVEFLADKLGETFPGTISGVTQWGFYVELSDSLAEGLVPMTELEDDYYELDEENYCIVGRHRRKVYQLGDPVAVRVARANLVERQLDFALAGSEKSERPPASPSPRPGRDLRRARRGDEMNPKGSSRRSKPTRARRRGK
ncbi:MAG: ribonuclease R [Odoribacteraceae bacterium]|jgi:ribonuclease R|nr:ribonuclease R [Odoribacteraceae bacterium]